MIIMDEMQASEMQASKWFEGSREQTLLQNFKKIPEPELGGLEQELFNALETKQNGRDRQATLSRLVDMSEYHIRLILYLLQSQGADEQYLLLGDAGALLSKLKYLFFLDDFNADVPVFVRLDICLKLLDSIYQHRFSVCQEYIPLHGESINFAKDAWEAYANDAKPIIETNLGTLEAEYDPSVYAETAIRLKNLQDALNHLHAIEDTEDRFAEFNQLTSRFVETCVNIHIENAINTRLTFAEREFHLMKAREYFEEIPANRADQVRLRQELTDRISKATDDLARQKLKFSIDKWNMKINSDLTRLEGSELDRLERLNVAKTINKSISDLKTEIAQFHRAVININPTLCGFYEKCFEFAIRYNLAISTDRNLDVAKKQELWKSTLTSWESLAKQHKTHKNLDNVSKHVQGRRNILQQFSIRFNNYIEQNLMSVESSESTSERDQLITHMIEFLSRYYDIIETAKNDDVFDPNDSAETRRDILRRFLIILDNHTDQNLISLESLESTSERDQLITHMIKFLPCYYIIETAERDGVLDPENMNKHKLMQCKNKLMTIMTTSINKNFADIASNELSLIERNQRIENMEILLQQFSDALKNNSIPSIPDTLTYQRKLQEFQGKQHELRSNQILMIRTSINENFANIESNELSLDERNRLFKNTTILLQQLKRALNQNHVPENAQHIQDELQELEHRYLINQNLLRLESRLLNFDMDTNEFSAEIRNFLEQFPDASEQNRFNAIQVVGEEVGEIVHRARSNGFIVDDDLDRVIAIITSGLLDIRLFSRSVVTSMKEAQAESFGDKIADANDLNPKQLAKILDYCTNPDTTDQQTLKKCGIICHRTANQYQLISNIPEEIKPYLELHVLSLVDSDINQNLGMLTSNLNARDQLDPIVRNQLFEMTKNLLQYQVENLNACNIDPDDDRRVALTNYINEFMTKMRQYISRNLLELKSDISECTLDSAQRYQLTLDTNNLLRQLAEILNQNLIPGNAEHMRHLQNLRNAEHMRHLQNLQRIFGNVICVYINRNLTNLESNELDLAQRDRLIVDTISLLQQLAEAVNQNLIPDDMQHLHNQLQTFRDKFTQVTLNHIDQNLGVLQASLSDPIVYCPYFDSTKNLLQLANTFVRDDQLQNDDNERLDELQARFGLAEIIDPPLRSISNILKLLNSDHKGSSEDNSWQNVIAEAENFVIRSLRHVTADYIIDTCRVIELGKQIAPFFSDMVKRLGPEELTNTERRNLRNISSAIARIYYIEGNRIPKDKEECCDRRILMDMSKRYNNPNERVNEDDLRRMIDRLIIAHFGDPNLPFIVEKLIKNMNSRDQFAILEATLRYMQDHKNEYTCWGQRVVSRLEILRNQIERENLVEVPGPRVEIVEPVAEPVFEAEAAYRGELGPGS